MLAIAAAVVAVLALIAAGFAWNQTQAARAAQATADKKTVEARETALPLAIQEKQRADEKAKEAEAGRW